MSPAARTTKLSPKITAQAPDARLRVANNWLISAPIARNMAAPATVARAKNNELLIENPVDGSRPMITKQIAVMTYNKTRLLVRPAKVFMAASRGEVWPDSSSSVRPAASSPRKYLVASKKAQMEPTMVSTLRVFQAA